jgi:hypothetical protein
MIARCQAKTTLKSYWHELRDHQEYSKKIAMKTGTHTQVPVPMTTTEAVTDFRFSMVLYDIKVCYVYLCAS